MAQSGLGQDRDAAQRWNLLRFFLQDTTHLAAAVDMTGGGDGVQGVVYNGKKAMVNIDININIHR